MNVISVGSAGDLKRALAALPDDTPVVAVGFTSGQYGSLRFDITSVRIDDRTPGHPIAVLHLE